MDDQTGTEPDGRSSQPPAGWRCRRAFPGEESRLMDVRAWLASLLPACPVRHDVLSIATELGANAVRHSASGYGGSFTIEIAWTPPLVRVAVADGGGLTEPRVTDDPLGEHGRGLLLVRGLAQRTGMDGDRHGRRVWADVAWDGPEPQKPGPLLGPREAAAPGEPRSRPQPPRTVGVARGVVPASSAS